MAEEALLSLVECLNELQAQDALGTEAGMKDAALCASDFLTAYGNFNNDDDDDYEEEDDEDDDDQEEWLEERQKELEEEGAATQRAAETICRVKYDNAPVAPATRAVLAAHDARGRQALAEAMRLGRQQLPLGQAAGAAFRT